MREFYANMKRYSTLVEQGENFIVTKNRKDLFHVTPVPQKKKYTRADLFKLSKMTKPEPGDRDMSSRIDEIVYGIK